MPRLPAAVAAALLAALLLTGAGPAEAATASSCSGRNLLKPGPLKVVDRTYARPNGGRGHRYRLCTRIGSRRKSIRLRGSRPGARLQILAFRGAAVAVRDPRSKAVVLWNVEKRTHRRLRHERRDPAGRVVVGEAGEAAAVFRSAAGGSTVVGFDHDGTSYALDTGAIPARSLRRARRDFKDVVTWTNAGAARSAVLSEPPLPCAALSGKRVLRTDRLTVVSNTFAVEVTNDDGPRGLNGRRVTTRACVGSGGPVRVLGTSERPLGGAAWPTSVYTVGTGAGTFVVARADFFSTDESTTFLVLDVATGREYPLTTRSLDGPEAVSPDPSGFEDVVLTAGGQSAALLGERLVGFGAGGQAFVLDTQAAPGDIPAASLSVSGTVVSWTNKGARRTADLAR